MFGSFYNPVSSIYKGFTAIYENIPAFNIEHYIDKYLRKSRQLYNSFSSSAHLALTGDYEGLLFQFSGLVMRGVDLSNSFDVSDARIMSKNIKGIYRSTKLAGITSDIITSNVGDKFKAQKENLGPANSPTIFYKPFTYMQSSSRVLSFIFSTGVNNTLGVGTSALTIAEAIVNGNMPPVYLLIASATIMQISYTFLRKVSDSYVQKNNETRLELLKEYISELDTLEKLSGRAHKKLSSNKELYSNVDKETELEEQSSYNSNELFWDIAPIHLRKIGAGIAQANLARTLFMCCRAAFVFRSNAEKYVQKVEHRDKLSQKIAPLEQQLGIDSTVTNSQLIEEIANIKLEIEAIKKHEKYKKNPNAAKMIGYNDFLVQNNIKKPTIESALEYLKASDQEGQIIKEEAYGKHKNNFFNVFKALCHQLGTEFNLSNKKGAFTDLPDSNKQNNLKNNTKLEQKTIEPHQQGRNTTIAKS